jgi:hypothetical protein
LGLCELNPKVKYDDTAQSATISCTKPVPLVFECGIHDVIRNEGIYVLFDIQVEVCFCTSLNRVPVLTGHLRWVCIQSEHIFSFMEG